MQSDQNFVASCGTVPLVLRTLHLMLDYAMLAPSYLASKAELEIKGTVKAANIQRDVLSDCH